MNYSIPTGVEYVQGHPRPLLSTQNGGRVAVDRTLLELWEYAKGRSLEAIVAGFQAGLTKPEEICAGMACLVEAGLLCREPVEPQPKTVARSDHGPAVAAVIVIYNNLEWLGECIPSLVSQTYEPLDIIIVDNGSQDGANAWLEEHYSQITRLRLEEPISFAGAVRQGVGLASQAAYYLLLNPDVTLEPGAVGEMVHVILGDERCAAVGAKLKFWWAPAFLNGLGNRVGPFSWGTDNGLGHLDLGQWDEWDELPSACFAAALIRREAWEAVGPIDSGFSMYYEDTEWSYRARLLGYVIRAAPRAVVYHAFGGRVPQGRSLPLSPRKLHNVVYGRLRFAFKIAGRSLPRFVIAYLTEDVLRQAMSLVTFNWSAWKAIWAGWKDFLAALPGLKRARKELQSRRVISDHQLFALQQDIPPSFIWRGMPELTWDLVTSYYTPLILSERTKRLPEMEAVIPSRPRLLIVSNDIVDEKMAGPGMRYFEMARALSEAVDVTLAVPAPTQLQVQGLRLAPYRLDRQDSLRPLVDACDVILVSSFILEKFPFLQTAAVRRVIDLYDPTILENLHYYLNEPLETQNALNRQSVEFTNRLIHMGDFFICGNERQRDFWLGFLAANGRVNPLNFQRDESLRALIDVVGVGFPDRALQAGPGGIRGVHPQVPADAQIVLWGGGIWNWLDPLTLIRAWPKVAARYPKARLVFLGTRHPNPQVPAHVMAQRAQDLAGEVGEKDRTIIFIEWLPYKEREALLGEASVGVTLHPVHIETRYSIRTRMLDYLWARLPVVVTEGDISSEWVREYGLGKVVPPFDEAATADALLGLLSRPKTDWADAFHPLFEQLRWSQVVKPLANYCLKGNPAPDRGTVNAGRQKGTGHLAAGGWRLEKAGAVLRQEGLGVLLHKIWRYIQWRFS